MKKAAVRLLVLLLAVLASASATIVLLSERSQVPEPWIKGNPAALDAQFGFKIFLKQRNVDEFQNRVLSMSDPESKHWLHFMTIDEILDFVAPEPSTITPVFSWLNESGVKSENIKNFRDSLLISTTVSVASKLFNTKFHTFTAAPQGGSTISVDRQWGLSHIPEEVLSLIDIFTGVDDFPALKQKLPVRNPLTAPVVDAGNIVPSVLRSVYSLPSRSVTNPKSSVGLIEFQNDASFSPVDLKNFQAQTDSIGTPVTKIVGPFNDASPDDESTLDVQYATAIADNTTIWFWTVKGWMLDFSQAFFNSKEVPLTVSMSWGWTEDKQCAITTCQGINAETYVARVNSEFAKIAGRGVSLFASSGDTGAYGPTNGYCYDAETATLNPLFPTDSPFVTSVGATMLLKSTQEKNTTAEPPICKTYQCSTSTTEGVCSYPQALITTGGGFSTYSARPDWQSAQVEKYLSSAALPPNDMFNRKGRAFPDISALGHNYLILTGGTWGQVDGTSCSSPVMAAIMALINDKRMNAGKKSIGFLAPLLYKLAEENNSAFRDVVAGNNKCTEECCGKYGYVSGKQWDPVTGLGTPNFPVLEDYLFNLA